MSAKTTDRIYTLLSRRFPEARSELVYKNNFELLLAVILSAQATDKQVNKVTATLFARYPTPAAILKCGPEKLTEIVKSIGLFATKSRNILKTCRILLDEHGGEVPGDREALERLPGVGRKTANVVLNEGFDHPTIAVDTHVFRVANRTGLAPGKNVRATEDMLLRVTPAKWRKTAHRLLILHGRYICTARNFDCSACVIRKECRFTEKRGTATYAKS